MRRWARVRPTIFRRNGKRIDLRIPDEPAGADLDPAGGGGLGDDSRLDPPPRPDRGVHRGSLLRGRCRDRLAGLGGFRSSVESGRCWDDRRLRVGARFRNARRNFRRGITTVCDRDARREQVPADQREVGQDGDEYQRGDRPDRRKDQDDQKSGPDRQDPPDELKGLGWLHRVFGLDEKEIRDGSPRFHSFIHRTIDSATSDFP